jgi:hypothetical protein
MAYWARFYETDGALKDRPASAIRDGQVHPLGHSDGKTLAESKASL